MGLRPATISDGDVSQAAACAAGLPPGRDGPGTCDDLVENLFLMVLGTRMHVTTMNNALAFYRQNLRVEVHDLRTLTTALSRFEDDRDGNTRLARYLWGNNYWTRAEMLRRIVRFFMAAGITGQGALSGWVRSADYSRDVEGRVKGLGYATFQSLAMRCGVDTVKPDVYTHRFTERCLGRSLTDSDVVELVTRTAKRLGIPARSLDAAIWQRENARGEPARAVPP